MPNHLLTNDDATRYAALMSHRFTRAIIGDARSVELVEEAARRFAVPVASIGLVGRTKVHFVAEIGTSLHVLPRAQSFSTYAIAGSAPLVVEDTSLDPRFVAHPSVVARQIRFFAAAPLIDGKGFRLGAFCIIDRQPRRMAPADIALLVRFAGQAMARVALLSVVSDLSRRATLPTWPSTTRRDVLDW